MIEAQSETVVNYSRMLIKRGERRKLEETGKMLKIFDWGKKCDVFDLDEYRKTHKKVVIKK